MWGEILQYAMIAVNVVPLIVSLVIVLVEGIGKYFRRRPPSALSGISPTRGEIGCGNTAGLDGSGEEATPD